MTAAEIAKSLGEARPEGDNWKCRCPLCGRPILSLRDNPAGRFGLDIHCFGGCTSAAVRAELKDRHLLDGKPNGHATAFDGARHQATEDAKRQAKTANALDFWRADTMPGDDTPGGVYLAGRLLMHRPMPDTLRFTYAIYHPSEQRTFPAVIALLEHEKLGRVAIHAICLNTLDPTSKLTIMDRKFSMGPVKGVRLSASSRPVRSLRSARESRRASPSSRQPESRLGRRSATTWPILSRRRSRLCRH